MYRIRKIDGLYYIMKDRRIIFTSTSGNKAFKEWQNLTMMCRFKHIKPETKWDRIKRRLHGLFK